MSSTMAKYSLRDASSAAAYAGSRPRSPVRRRTPAAASALPVRAQHGEELGLQALVVAVAHLVEERRALGVLRHALHLRLRQPPHPVLQSLDVALGRGACGARARCRAGSRARTCGCLPRAAARGARSAAASGGRAAARFFPLPRAGFPAPAPSTESYPQTRSAGRSPRSKSRAAPRRAAVRISATPARDATT